jgi:hypothetical protein
MHCYKKSLAKKNTDEKNVKDAQTVNVWKTLINVSHIFYLLKFLFCSVLCP